MELDLAEKLQIYKFDTPDAVVMTSFINEAERLIKQHDKLLYKNTVLMDMLKVHKKMFAEEGYIEMYEQCAEMLDSLK